MAKEQWRVNTGIKEKEARRYYTNAVKPLLKKWIKETGKRRICPICGEDMPETFHEHHLDGNHSNKSKSNLVDICGSCHVITYSAKTRLMELWTQRHEKVLTKRKAAQKAWQTRNSPQKKAWKTRRT